MANKTFKVTAAFTTYGYIEVVAKDADEAKELAQDTDGGDFITIDPLERSNFEVKEAIVINNQNNQS